MRRNTEDKTLERNYISKWRFLIREYLDVKAKKHPQFRFASDFYKFHGTNRQTFLKYYNRFKLSGDSLELVPQKRGPKWKSRRILGFVEQKVLQERRKGINRYEIYQILKPILKGKTPSVSSIYRISKRYGLNRLGKVMKQNRRKIIKEKAGELAHVDCHHLSRDMITGDNKRYYLVCIMDDCTRIAWAEVVEDIKSLTVMFSVLKSINLINEKYNIRFAEAMTDNGSEFASRNNQQQHPFERMLLELGIRHRYTRPYRPQTNGKVERFWRTLNEDLIEGTTFDSLDHFKDEVLQYLVYYNELRPHQGINAKTPKEMNESCQRISEHVQSSGLTRGSIPISLYK